MSQKIQTQDLVLIDIIRGYSVLQHDDGEIYLKHFSVLEYLELDEYEQTCLNEAIESGVKSEQQLISEAIEYGYWSIQEEEKIKSTRWLISKSEESLSKITDNLQKRSFSANIEKYREEIKELEVKKNKILYYSAESLALRQRAKKLICDCFYKDKEFKEKLVIDANSMIYNSAFIKISNLFNKELLVKAAYTPTFFEGFIVQYRNPLSLFGCRYHELTYFQSKLLAFANSLFSKLKNISNIPDEIAQDPNRLLNYSEKSDQKDSKTSEGVGDLRKKLRAKGSLTAEDFLT